MPIFLREENSELKGNMYQIPDKIQNHLKDTLIQVGGNDENNPIHKEKGFKRLNALVNPDYNKRSKKQDKLKGNNISYHELKRIKNVFDHTVNNEKNPIYTLNGGTPMKNWVNNTLSRERNKVEPINKQKKVQTRSKNAIKPVSNPTKPIEAKDSRIYVRENKKIYINENQLQELYNQLTIPFDGNPKKYNYEYFIDYLEEIGHYGKLEPCNEKINMHSLIYDKNYMKNVFIRWFNASIPENEGISDTVDRSIRNDIATLVQYYPDLCDQNESKFAELTELLDSDANYDFLFNYTDYHDLLHYLEYYLTENGVKYVMNSIFDIFTESVDYYGLSSNLRINENGLVMIERVIELPPLLKKTVFKDKDESDTDFFKINTENHGNGIGIYWTWEECGGDVYWMEYHGDCVTIEAVVNPHDIDWEKTFFQNATMEEEKEITLYPDAQVQINAITTVVDNDKVVHLPLKSPIIVPA